MMDSNGLLSPDCGSSQAIWINNFIAIWDQGAFWKIMVTAFFYLYIQMNLAYLSATQQSWDNMFDS